MVMSATSHIPVGAFNAHHLHHHHDGAPSSSSSAVGDSTLRIPSVENVVHADETRQDPSSNASFGSNSNNNIHHWDDTTATNPVANRNTSHLSTSATSATGLGLWNDYDSTSNKHGVDSGAHNQHHHSHNNTNHGGSGGGTMSSNHNIWGNLSNNAKQQPAVDMKSHDPNTSFYSSASTNNASFHSHHQDITNTSGMSNNSKPWYPQQHPTSTGADPYSSQYHNNHMSDLSGTMSQLQLGTHHHHHPYGGDNASIASSSIPGVVGASSGSTGGSTAITQHTWNSSSNGHHHHYSNKLHNHHQQHPHQQYQNHGNSYYAPPSNPDHRHHNQFSPQKHYGGQQQQGEQLQQHPGVGLGLDSSWNDHSHRGLRVAGEDHHPSSPVMFDHQGSVPTKNKNIGGGGTPRNNKGKKKGTQRKGKGQSSHHDKRSTSSTSSYCAGTITGEEGTVASSKASSEAIRMLMKNPSSPESNSLSTTSQLSALTGSRLPLDRFSTNNTTNAVDNNSIKGPSLGGDDKQPDDSRPILPSIDDVYPTPLYVDDEEDDEDETYQHWNNNADGDNNTNSSVGNGNGGGNASPTTKKREWLLRMNRRLQEVPVGELDPSSIPISAIMNAWAKTKCAKGASIVETWLNRAQQEFSAGNDKVIPTTKMYTMAGKLQKKTMFVLCALLSQTSGFDHSHDSFLLRDFLPLPMMMFTSRCLGKKWRGC